MRFKARGVVADWFEEGGQKDDSTSVSIGVNAEEHPGKQADCNPSLLNFLINFSNQSKKLLCITAKMSVQWSTPGKFIQGLKFNYIDGKWPVFV